MEADDGPGDEPPSRGWYAETPQWPTAPTGEYWNLKQLSQLCCTFLDILFLNSKIEPLSVNFNLRFGPIYPTDNYKTRVTVEEVRKLAKEGGDSATIQVSIKYDIELT